MKYGKRQDVLHHIQTQLQQCYQTRPKMMLEIIEPDNDVWILKLTTTTAILKNPVETNTACENQHQQVTTLAINKLSGSVIKY